MDDVISLGVGEPDFDTPRAIVEAGVGVAPRGAHALHLELRDPRAAARARRPPRAALRRPLRPGDRAAHHGRRVGGRGPRPARHLRPGRRGHPPRAVVRRLRAGHRLRRRDGPPRRDPLRGRLRARPGGRRGGHHAADQGAVPRLPVQPDRRGPADRDPGRAGGASPSATTSSCTATRSTTASPTATTRIGDERAARDARADDPDGRLLEGVRDDRLAGRLPGRPGRDPRGHRQDPPVRDHVGLDDRPGRGAGRPGRGRARGRADASRVRPSPPAHRRRAQRRSASRRSSRAARSMRSRGSPRPA